MNKIRKLLKLLKDNKGMTLSELLVGIAMFALLIAAISGVLIPLSETQRKINEIAELGTLVDGVANVIITEVSSSQSPPSLAASTDCADCGTNATHPYTIALADHSFVDVDWDLACDNCYEDATHESHSPKICATYAPESRDILEVGNVEFSIGSDGTLERRIGGAGGEWRAVLAKEFYGKNSVDFIWCAAYDDLGGLCKTCNEPVTAHPSSLINEAYVLIITVTSDVKDTAVERIRRVYTVKPLVQNQYV